MVSLQSESTPWFHYNRELPDEDDYVSTYVPTTCPSYVCDMQLIPPTLGDLFIEDDIQHYLQNSFVREYISSPLRCSETSHYTLFLPIECVLMDQAVAKINQSGFSFEDRVMRVEGASERDQLLQSHICPVLIYPEQIQERDTRITTLGGQFMINSYGWISPTVSIKYMRTYPHATIYFISEEISF